MKPIPIFRAAHLLPHLTVLREFGVPIEHWLQKAKLPSMIGDQPDAYLPVYKALHFLTETSHAEGIEDLGIRAALLLKYTDLNQNLVAVLNEAPTLYVALQAICELFSIEDNIVNFWILPAQENTKICSSFNVLSDMQGVSISEWEQNLVLVSLVQAFAGPAWYPREMAFRSNLTIGRYAKEQFPNTRFLTGEKAAWITLPRSMMSLPPRIKQPGLSSHSTLKSAIENNMDFPASLKSILQSYLRDGYLSIELAAEITNTSVRTLQRRLQEFNLKYSDLVHHAQFESAAQLLKDPHMRTLDIAYDVGYEDPSNFSRAFRRIAGVSPREYRRQFLAN